MIRLDVISEVVDVVDRQDEQVNLAVADVETVTLNVCDNDRVYLTAQDPDILETKVLGVGYLVTAIPYEGPYRVTPSNQQQTLPTQNKDLSENIIVEAVDDIQTETKTANPSQQAQTIIPTPGKYLAAVNITAIQTEEKSATPSTAQQEITPASGKFLTKVTVGAIQTEEKTATPNTSQQDITPTSGKFLTKVTVGAIQTEEKSATPSTSQQDITPTSGKFLSKVTVGAIQTEEKTATPSTTQQEITPASGKFLSKVTVDAVELSGTANEAKVLNGYTFYKDSLTKKTGTILSQSARTVYPTGSVQTGIPAGKYASGAVTVGKVVTANILADNIKNGVTITVGNDSNPSEVISVTGTYQGQGGYTCSFDSNWSSMYGSGRMGPVTITYSNGQTSSFPNNDMDGMTFNNVVSITFVETEYEYWMINYSVGGSSDTLWLNAGDTETYTLSGNTTFYDFSK